MKFNAVAIAPGFDARRARVSVLCLLALAAVLCQSQEARAQWTTPNAQGNINTTNTGNVGIGMTAPTFLLDVQGSTNTPFRVRDTAGNEYFSTSSRTGPWGTTPIAIMAGGRLMVEHNGPDGDNHTIVRRLVNSMIFNPSDHPDLPGGLLVRRKGGAISMWVDQGLTGNVGVGMMNPTFLLDVSGSAGSPFRVRDSAGREYFSTSTRTGPWGTTPIASLAGGRLIVEHNGPDGDNHTIVRRLVNSMIFNPSDHPDLPGGLLVRQKGGAISMWVDQGATGNVGIGTMSPQAKLHVTGDIRVDGNINAKYQDVAEWVPSTQKLAAGTVVILDADRLNHVLASGGAYDTRVAGVVSARPGISLGDAGDDKALVATTGRVKVKVDATQGPIKVGDLLVTSATPGVAMKSQPLDLGGVPIHRPGTIIGKALEPLAGGTGEILVLLSLQ